MYHSPMQSFGTTHEPFSLMSMPSGQKQPTPSVCVGLGLAQLGGGTIPQPDVWSAEQSKDEGGRMCIKSTNTTRVMTAVRYIYCNTT